jgi:hypothetical protein
MPRRRMDEMTELSHPLQTFVEDEVRTYAQRTIAFG